MILLFIWTGSLIAQVRLVLRRTIVSSCGGCFNNLSRSYHDQGQSLLHVHIGSKTGFSEGRNKSDSLVAALLMNNNYTKPTVLWKGNCAKHKHMTNLSSSTLFSFYPKHINASPDHWEFLVSYILTDLSSFYQSGLVKIIFKEKDWNQGKTHSQLFSNFQSPSKWIQS